MKIHFAYPDAYCIEAANRRLGTRVLIVACYGMYLGGDLMIGGRFHNADTLARRLGFYPNVLFGGVGKVILAASFSAHPANAPLHPILLGRKWPTSFASRFSSHLLFNDIEVTGFVHEVLTPHPTMVHQRMEAGDGAHLKLMLKDFWMAVSRPGLCAVRFLGGKAIEVCDETAMIDGQRLALL